MVMRTGVQTPVLPLGTSVLPLCAGDSQRAASAASCGWCGSMSRAWRAKGYAHLSRQLRPGTQGAAAAPPHWRGEGSSIYPEAQSMEDVVVAQWSCGVVGGDMGLRRLL